MSAFGPGYNTAAPLPPATLAYGGFWVRVLAYLIDGIILNVILWTLVLAGGADMSRLDLTDPASMPMGWGLTLGPLIVTAVYTVGFWVSSGATPGKMALGLRVVGAQDGMPIPIGRAIGRFLGYFVSSFAFMLGFLWVAFDARKQGWHDKLASTVVVRRVG